MICNDASLGVPKWNALFLGQALSIVLYPLVEDWISPARNLDPSLSRRFPQLLRPSFLIRTVGFFAARNLLKTLALIFHLAPSQVAYFQYSQTSPPVGPLFSTLTKKQRVGAHLAFPFSIFAFPLSDAREDS